MARRLGIVFATAVIALAATSSHTASANGRYVRAQELLTDPSDARRLWLRATYGVLTSPDDGKSWSWICETALGISDGEDPAMVVAADGGVLVGGSTGLFFTTDHGCTFRPHSDVREYVVDLTSPDDGQTVLALTNVVQSTGASDLYVWRSDDAGRRFAKIGGAISTDLFGMTLDVAPSDPSRIYVTGVPAAGATPVDPTTPGVLLRSRDGAGTWERVTVSGTNYETWPMIAAVHPTSPDTVYVRVRGPANPSATIESWLVISDDAGATFREAFRGPSEMFGFALLDSGSTLLLGMGDSYDRTNQRPVDRSALGVYRSTNGGASWSPGLAGQVGCLERGAAGLYVCSTHESLGMELGLSADQGVTMTKLLDFGAQISLPACSTDGSSAAQCADLWSSVCRTIGPCGGVPATPPAAAAGARGGCGCRVRGTRNHEGWLAAILGALVVSGRRLTPARSPSRRSSALESRRAPRRRASAP